MVSTGERLKLEVIEKYKVEEVKLNLMDYTESDPYYVTLDEYKVKEAVKAEYEKKRVVIEDSDIEVDEEGYEIVIKVRTYDWEDRISTASRLKLEVSEEYIEEQVRLNLYSYVESEYIVDYDYLNEDKVKDAVKEDFRKKRIVIEDSEIEIDVGEREVKVKVRTYI